MLDKIVTAALILIVAIAAFYFMALKVSSAVIGLYSEVDIDSTDVSYILKDDDRFLAELQNMNFTDFKKRYAERIKREDKALISVEKLFQRLEDMDQKGTHG